VASHYYIIVWATVTSISIPGGLSLRPVKNRGYILCPSVSYTSLFSLYPVKYKFIANCSAAVTSILIAHLTSAFWQNIFSMADGGSGGRGSFRKGGMSPISTLDLGDRSHCGQAIYKH